MFYYCLINAHYKRGIFIYNWTIIEGMFCIKNFYVKIAVFFAKIFVTYYNRMTRFSVMLFSEFHIFYSLLIFPYLL